MCGNVVQQFIEHTADYGTNSIYTNYIALFLNSGL